MSYRLICDDSLNVEIPTCDLVFTDAPHINTLSTEDLILRLEKIRAVTCIVCRDDTIAIQSCIRFIQKNHAAFGGSRTEKANFAQYYIGRYTKPRDLVIDPFCGYSSTGVAALRLGRRYIGIDNKPVAIEESERLLSKVDNT